MFKSNVATNAASNVVKFFSKDSKKPVVTVAADNMNNVLLAAKMVKCNLDKNITLPEIHESTDYKSFKLLKENRPVNPSHVNLLMNSVLLYEMVLRVGVVVETSAFSGITEKYHVDGQHLFGVHEILNIPFRYILFKTNDKKLIVTIMATMNNTGKKWGLSNYVDCWVAMNNPNYIEIKKIHEESKVTYTVLLPMFSAGKMDSRTRKELKIGEFVMNNAVNGKALLKDLKAVNTIVTQTKFSDDGYIRFRKNIGKMYNHDLFYKQLKIAYGNIRHSFGKTKDALEFFTSVYDSIYEGVYQNEKKTPAPMKKGAKKTAKKK